MSKRWAVACGTEKRRENLRSRMSKPKRIQRSRAKGWKMPANAIYVGRPTVWGNPYVVGSELMNGETLTAEKAVALYEQHLADNFNERDIRHCLRDKDLAPAGARSTSRATPTCCCGSRTRGRSSPRGFSQTHRMRDVARP